MSENVIETVLSTAAKIINQVKNNFTNYYTDNSLVEATKLTRVEPLVVISKDCLSLEITKDVLECDLNMFSAYYMQAVSMLTKVNNVEVIKVLDKLNPDRDSSGFLLSAEYAEEAAKLHLEDQYKYKLPTLESVSLESIALEAKTYRNGPSEGNIGSITNNNDNSRNNTTNHTGDILNNNSRTSFNFSTGGGSGGSSGGSSPRTHNSQDAVDTLNEMASMATGKMLNVEIVVPDQNGQSVMVTIPVSVRLMPSLVSNSTVSHLLTYQSEDTSMKERFHAWRAGRINFISDLIFCQDLIDEYKRASMGDNSGTMAEIARRVQNAKKYGLLTKNPSLAAASNLFVMSKAVANDVEMRLRGKLSNPKVREKAFKNTYGMIIAVIDSEIDRVTFYTRGQASAADFSFREIKSASKSSKGPDIMDIMKAMQQSAPISF